MKEVIKLSLLSVRTPSFIAFLKKLKPACEENINLLPEKIKSKLFTFPHHFLCGKSEPFIVFFQSEPMKHQFLAEINGLHVREPEFARIMGKYLGYPPKAVDFWVNHRKNRDLNYFHSVSTKLHYCGISCADHIDNLVESARWLWETYNYDMPLTVNLIDLNKDDWVDFYIPFKDESKLLDVKKEAELVLEKNKSFILAQEKDSIVLSTIHE